jgi:uncharacterized protein (DUF302 family)
VVAVVVMRFKMIIAKTSRFDFKSTVSSVEKAISDAGWLLVESMRLNDNLQKHGVDFGPRVQLIKLCKAEYSASVLKKDRQMACLMPCTIAVYESDDGRVLLSKMNTGLMGKACGGNIARVMGGFVAADEKKMLQGIIARCGRNDRRLPSVAAGSPKNRFPLTREAAFSEVRCKIEH